MVKILDHQGEGLLLPAEADTLRGDPESAIAVFLPRTIAGILEASRPEGRVFGNHQSFLIGTGKLHKLGGCGKMKCFALTILYAGVVRIDLREQPLLLDLIDGIAALRDGLIAIFLLFLHHIAGLDKRLV